MSDGNTVVYVLCDSDVIVGYCVYEVAGLTSIKLDWIYAPDYGKILMKKLEIVLKENKIKEIFLNVSIDPNESKDTVMKRLNFYSTLKYKVYDVDFRKKYGPLLYMKKLL